MFRLIKTVLRRKKAARRRAASPSPASLPDVISEQWRGEGNTATSVFSHAAPPSEKGAADFDWRGAV